MRRGRELIYLVAPAGHPNFGDEFIASAWLRELARRRERRQAAGDAGGHRAGTHPGRRGRRRSRALVGTLRP